MIAKYGTTLLFNWAIEITFTVLCILPNILLKTIFCALFQQKSKFQEVQEHIHI